MTIATGGPFQGVVTLTAIAEGHGRSIVDASWTENGHQQADSVEVDGFEQARTLAHRIADQLAAGIPFARLTPVGTDRAAIPRSDTDAPRRIREPA